MKAKKKTSAEDSWMRMHACREMRGLHIVYSICGVIGQDGAYRAPVTSLPSPARQEASRR